jgi:uracil-DNA glycosylase
MDRLFQEIKSCRTCESFLEAGLNPVIAASKSSKIIVIGQAPGRKVHLSGVPWDDKSGENLRKGLGVDKETFYEVDKMALIPMGFCYPGKGMSGDLPPRPECAPLWHLRLLSQMKEVKLTLLIGNYAQRYYLGRDVKQTLTETVRNFKEYLPKYLPLPHPSPRNNIWQRKNEWFGEEVLPELKAMVHNLI